MYRSIFLALIVTLGFGSCEKKNVEYPECLNQFGTFSPDNKPGDGEVEFVFYENSDLSVSDDENRPYIEKIAGDKLVFRYEYTADDSPNIADDEYSEIVWFAVDPEGDSFEIHENDFKNSGATFGRMCFCVDRGFHWIKKGCIYGAKLGDGKWEITFAIESETNFETYTRMIQAEFLVSL
jgi:hypothetical protein